MSANILLTKLKRHKIDRIPTLYKDKKNSKFNPDVNVNYKKDLKEREKNIKPLNYQINIEKIKETKEDLNKLLMEKMKQRDETIDIPKNIKKKKIIDNSSKDYITHKMDAKKIIEDTEKKLEENKKITMSILNKYS